MPLCQSNQKICLLRTSRSPAALASARGRPPSSPDARGALSSPRRENRGGLAAITALTPSLICLLLMRSTDFSSRRTPSALSHTLTQPPCLLPRPPVRSPGKGNWTERFTFRRAASAAHSAGSLAVAGPGSPRRRSSWAGSELGRPPPASPQVARFRRPRSRF